MNLLVVTGHYPVKQDPVRGIFVKNTVSEMTSLGVTVDVIAPLSFKLRYLFRDLVLEDENVALPLFFKVPAKLMRLNIFGLKQYFFTRSVVGAYSVKRQKNVYDAVYAHFLFPAGDAALAVAKRADIPAYLALGESDFKKWEKFFSIEQLANKLNNFNRIFPNSPSLSELLVSRYKVSQEKVVFVPNGVNTDVFYPRDKKACRAELNLPQNVKIVLFVGGFVERKGPLRVLEACRQMKHKPLMVFLGKGQQQPIDERILFKGAVNQTLLVKYLNAADVFVLPTTNEGMPNAILEAMACNLPIVTSDIPVNKYLLEEYASARVCDPYDQKALSVHIAELLDDLDVLPTVFKYSVRNRAKRLLRYIMA
ncbi:MAG: glycosyltransferase family 4 protein [Oleiphilaceae bacterium]|nr:glycosyltransferase family 4 protein [Oleiphilaceae bacterium]